MGTQNKRKMKLTPLDILADRLGIESEYCDARQKVQRTSPETKRALLAAMSVPANDDAQIRAALKELDRTECERPLAPASVAYQNTGPAKLELRLPPATREVCWHLLLEDGTEKSGRVNFNTLAPLATYEAEGNRVECRQFVLEGGVPSGYHRLKIDSGDARARETVLIVTPGRCWLPSSVVNGRRVWGIAAQLYLLRSADDWGIGDFTDLRRFAGLVSAAGADIVGLNPLHQLFLDTPEHASPYSPASRLLLNVLNIGVAAVPGFANCAGLQRLIASDAFQQKLAKCRAAKLVDYTTVSELKLQAFALLFEHWKSSADAQCDSFESFRREQGEMLERNCVFHSVRQMFAHCDPNLSDWRRWPEEYRDPSSPAIARFASEHRDEITFRAWLQWIADSQLASAAAAAKDMEIGLYRDMAVGADVSGVETWSNQTALVSGVHIGAPPDIYNPAGQDWGLPPFHPRALKEEGYRSFIELIRANMRHAGALRIDHVMALQHLYWVPKGGWPKNGAYMRYPLEELVGILALESQRNQCLVVGEDLGTVPDGFRDRMAHANILSYRVLFFERKAKSGAFRRPNQYPVLSVAVASNHDLPTIRAWWEGRDIDLKERLHLFPESGEAQRQQRERDRKQLLRAMKKERLLPPKGEFGGEDLIPFVHAYLARSKSFLAMPQIDDISGEIEPVNLPASSSEYPNWHRRLSLTLEELATDSRLKQSARIFQSERGLLGHASNETSLVRG